MSEQLKMIILQKGLTQLFFLFGNQFDNKLFEGLKIRSFLNDTFPVFLTGSPVVIIKNTTLTTHGIVASFRFLNMCLLKTHKLMECSYKKISSNK